MVTDCGADLDSVKEQLIQLEKKRIIESSLQNALTNLIQNLQLVVDTIQTTRAEITHSEHQVSNDTRIIKIDCASSEPSLDTAEEPRIIQVDPALVQIQADNSEIERRIRAFVEKKRVEADSLNVREFCNVMKQEPDESQCARTDAVYMSSVEGRSHVRVSRVNNQYGPQTQAFGPKKETNSLQSRATNDSSSQLPVGVEERLCNMEQHLDITRGKPVPRSVYGRIQQLEDRILHLESLSPEYFSIRPPERKKLKLETGQQHRESEYSLPSNAEDLRLSDIQQRIQQLKQSLLSKQYSQHPPIVKMEPN